MATAKKKAKSKSKSRKKAPARKPAAPKKAPPRKKKPAVKKAPARKPAAKKTAVKKSAAKQPAAKKPVAKPAAPPPKRPVVILSAVAVAPRIIPASRSAPAAVPEHRPMPGEEPVGVVTHYYNHLSVAVVQLDIGSLEVGDTVRFLGHTTDFRQRVDSLEIEHQSVNEVGRRQSFGMKVKDHVREHDVVYKVPEAFAPEVD